MVLPPCFQCGSRGTGLGHLVHPPPRDPQTLDNNKQQSYIQHLTQQTFRSTLQDSTPLAIRHLTKKSIASGIKKVYQQVSTQKWKRVTELSVLVLQQLDSPDVQPEPPTTSAGRSAEMDEMAPLTTQSFCELYRSA